MEEEEQSVLLMLVVSLDLQPRASFTVVQEDLLALPENDLQLSSHRGRGIGVSYRD